MSDWTRDVTVIVPFKRGGNTDWLGTALSGLKGVRRIIAENDGELAEALNAALAAATTEFVFRLDADDKIESTDLEILVAAGWDADVVYPSLVFCLEDLTPFETRKAGPFCPNRLTVENYISGCSLFRPEKALEVGGYRDLDICEDWDLWVRMAQAGHRFKGCPEALYRYRRHGVSRNTRPVDQIEAVKTRIRDEVIGTPPELKASFYYQAAYATTYWRCLLPARFLPGQAVDHAAGVAVERDGETWLDFREHRGAAVFQFPGDGARAVMMAEMQQQGIPVFVESDDNYFDLSPLGNPGWVKNVKPSAKEMQDPNNRGGAHSLEAHRKIVPWADGVIVTTEQLAKRYRRYNANVWVCPNQIDPQDWPEPKSDGFLPLSQGRVLRDDDGVFRVGWFASPSHRDDAKLIRRALTWAGAQDDVQVLVMGMIPDWIHEVKNVVVVPWSNDPGVYRKVIGWLDVGLCPVVETPWSVCRSDLKALELGMAGAVPVMSDVAPYRGYEGPGFKVREPREFLSRVRWLVQNRDDARRLAADARAHVLKERTMETNIWRWHEALASSVASKAA